MYSVEQIRQLILDGNKKKTIGIKQYNPLLDKYLFSYFSSENNKNFLKLNGFIANDGEIIYDPIYRETLGFDKTMNKVLVQQINFCLDTTGKILVIQYIIKLKSH